MKKLDAVLFDLDGTLLPMDTDEFMKQYLHLVSSEMAVLMPPKQFISSLLAATGDMITNQDPMRTNQEVFLDSFFKLTKLDSRRAMPLFDQFYREKFPELAKYTSPNPLAPRVVETTVNRGCQVIIATNAIFPRPAILERLRWAGVDHFPYTYITTYENMHFCKPNLDYYREILEKNNLDAARCLMVGNDMEEDMIAKELGMQTFLVEECLLQRGQVTIEPDAQGTLADLLAYFDQVL